jgi:hypothetical protein
MKAIFALLLAIALVWGTAAPAQEGMQVVENDVFTAPRRPPAIFRHDAHNAAAAIEACNACHHVYENGQRVEDESSEDLRCSDCHAEAADGAIPGLMDAFHRNCKGCHAQQGQGPLMCGECHQR